MALPRSKRVGRAKGEQCSHGLLARVSFQHGDECLGRDERRITIQHEHRIGFAFQRRLCLQDCVAGAQLRLLYDELGRLSQCLAHEVRTVADDNARARPGELMSHVHHVAHHRPAAHALQHLGQV